MVQRYAHLALDFQARAIDKLNALGTIRAQSPKSTISTSPPETRNPKVSFGVETGALGKIRTYDLSLTKGVLYP